MDISLLASLPSLGIGAADLAAAFLFLYGLHRMASPVTALSGIFVAGIGMAVAVLASFLHAFDVGSAARPHLWVNIGLAIVALALGGGAAGAIAAVELFGAKTNGLTALAVTLLGAVIGAVSLSGSLIAWAKLDGVIRSHCASRASKWSTAWRCWQPWRSVRQSSRPARGRLRCHSRQRRPSTCSSASHSWSAS